MVAPPPFRWGIAGFGWVARDFVAPAMEAAGHVLVGVADPDPAARKAAVSRGVRAHASVADLVADPSVDAIYVATPNDRHREAVEAAALAGRAILCEKPMAATREDAEAMAAASQRHGVFYRTAFDQRHHPAHRSIRDAIEEGRVGTVTAVRIVYACWLGPDWCADNWRIDPTRAGGGALIDLAPHGLDLAEFLLGDPIVSVGAVLQHRVQAYAVDDGALVSARTDAGVLVSLHVAYNHPETLPRRRLEVVGTAGLIAAQDTMGQEPGGSVTLTPSATGGDGIALRFDRDASPFREQVKAFAALCRSGVEPDGAISRDLALHRLLLDAAERARCP